MAQTGARSAAEMVETAAAAAMCWGPFDEAAPEAERRAFHWDAEFFRPYTDPPPDGSQSVDDFRAGGFRRLAAGGRKTVYLQPLGSCWSHAFALAEARAAAKQQRKRKEDMPTVVPPQLDALRRFLSAFLGGLHCVLLDPLPLPGGRRGRTQARGPAVRELRGRLNENNPAPWKIQLYAGDALEWIRMHAPGDSFLTIGVTHQDLYDEPSQGHCLSAAADGVGVISFARLDPVFYGCARSSHARKLLPGRITRLAGEDSSDAEGAPESALRRVTGETTENWYLWTLKRVCRLCGNAALHAMGARACTVFECLLNPTGLEEVDVPQRTLLCVVCLKKLHLATGCDLLRRYQLLGRFFWDFQGAFASESLWVGSRFEWIARGASRVQLPLSQPPPHGQAADRSRAARAFYSHDRSDPAVLAKITTSVAPTRKPSQTGSFRRSSSRSRTKDTPEEPPITLGIICSAGSCPRTVMHVPSEAAAAPAMPPPPQPPALAEPSPGLGPAAAAAAPPKA
eukprot:Hpha_TRINITY_DN10842_c0_g1::TRINITY_DN10842_c0_g1_i1::g.23261::m.23261/K06974/amzA, AMZ2, AMZ1; archaemetzincin